MSNSSCLCVPVDGGDLKTRRHGVALRSIGRSPYAEDDDLRKWPGHKYRYRVISVSDQAHGPAIR